LIPGGGASVGGDDIRITFYSPGGWSKDTEMFHLWLNTGFVPLDGSRLSLRKEELDGAHKDKHHHCFDEEFRATFEFAADQDALDIDANPPGSPTASLTSRQRPAFFDEAARSPSPVRSPRSEGIIRASGSPTSDKLSVAQVGEDARSGSGSRHQDPMSPPPPPPHEPVRQPSQRE